MARIQEPKLKVIFEEGEVSHEESLKVASLVINEMLHWDYPDAAKKEAVAS